ncbi:Mannosyl-oligosaccharide 1,2-alpha-mannosidase IB [Camponotus floridanus]|uniref:alpha-1,2-Mannosidase n=1 Tax=Camponotus floridanus TaxID=104421 RepID=E2AM30_CAMFO|nr:Mannosyl-oligosaccharide 1,2-alpha-mannosidase IB [Camponotus floridanus]
MINLKDLSHSTRSSANTSAIQSETPGGWSSCKCLDDMRLMQRLAISGLLSVILILLLMTGTIVTRRDTFASVIDRGVAPEERNEQLNPAWVQENVVPGQNEPEIEDRDKDKDRRLDIKHKQSEPSAIGPPAVSVPGAYVIRPPNPPLDDVTNQRREKVKEMMKHGWDNYVRYAWGKNELRPISKRGHSASIFGASNMGATIVDGLDTLYIMGLHDEFKQGRDWIAENLDFDIVSIHMLLYFHTCYQRGTIPFR